MKTLYIKSILSLFVYLHIAIAPQAFAAARPTVVYFQSNNSSDSDFKALVRNTRGAITLSDYALELSPTSDDKHRLLTLLESAQKEYLEGSLELAKTSFESITRISRDADWTIEERKSIFYAYMRVASLTSDTVARRQWLSEAARFDYELNPDKTIFTPPLVKEFDSIRKEEVSNAKNWDISAFKENIVTIKVNGKKYGAQYGGSIKLLNGANRIVFISNKNMPIARVLNANQALATTIPKEYYSLGTCNNPIVNNVPFNLKNRSAVFFNSDCILLSEGEDWKLKDQKQLVATNNTINNASNLEQTLKRDDEKLKSSGSNSKLWVLGIIAAGITTALILSAQNTAEPTRQPTHQ